jgi:hypothetical protein
VVIALLPGRLVAALVADAERAWSANVLASSALVAGALALVEPAGLPGTCLAAAVLGVPCPFCGMTRSVSRCLHGDLAGAVALHPVGLVVAAVLLAQIPLRAGALAGLFRLPYARERPVVAALHAAIVALCLGWFVVRLLR